MTHKAYLAALRKLELSVGGARTAEVFGLSRRQLTRYATGIAEVSGPLEKLIRQYLEHGLPEQD